MKIKLSKALSLFLAVILSFGAITPAFASDEIPEGYTPIYTAEDLNNIRNNLSGSYILMNDIDLSEYNWVAIGTYEEPFTGVFDGNNKVINNLTIQIFTEEAVTYAALFGAVSGGEIKNVTVKNCDIDVEAKSGKVWGVRASGMVSLGNKGASIENCIATGDISVKTDGDTSAGGIGAGFSGKISKCKSQVNISVNILYDALAWVYIGGVAGTNSVEINESCNYGNLSVTFNRSNIRRGIHIGGIVGDSLDGTINNCYNIGSISADTNQALILGGISGYSTTITNCHNYGEISAPEENSSVGGISGNTLFWSQSGTGLEESEIIAELTNCYYINKSIPATDTARIDEELMTNIKYLSAEEFKAQESFTGFDFENIWTMNGKQTYPVLRNEPETIENEPEPEPPIEPDPTPDPEPECLLLRIAKWICRTVLYLFNAIRGLF